MACSGREVSRRTGSLSVTSLALVSAATTGVCALVPRRATMPVSPDANLTRHPGG